MAVTMLIAIVLVESGKCLPTTDIGILIAVPPRPIPINKPMWIWKKIPVFGPVYKKYIKKSKKYSVHDKNNKFKNGEFVSIQENRPISKTKKWIVIN